MQYAQALGRRISRLTVGTVQFGMVYGIANTAGQLPAGEARAILSQALQGGVNVFDTARAYGTSEDVLGLTLWELTTPEETLICTKLLPLDLSHTRGDSEICRQVEEELRTSLDRLRLKRVPIYMMHRPYCITDRDGLVLRLLRDLKQQQLIEHIGVSVYEPDEAHLALATPGIEAIQVPFSVFDQRLRLSGFLEKAKRKGCAVFARSAYLQGLMLMQEQDVPKHLADVIGYNRLLRGIAFDVGRTLKEVALKFALGQPGITSVVMGIDSAEQMRENLAVLRSPALAEGTVARIQETFQEVPEFLINPSLWDR